MAESSPSPDPPVGSVPESVKKSVRAVLLSKIGGVPLHRFLGDYRKLDGNPLDFKVLGFKSLREFLDAMPDVVSLKKSEQAGLLMLYGIADPKSYISSAQKKAQFARPNDGVKEKKKMFKGKNGQGGKNQQRFNNKGGDGPKTQSNASPNKKGNYPGKTHGRRRPNDRGDASARASPIDFQGRSARATPIDFQRGSVRGSPVESVLGDGEVHVAKSHRGLYTVCVRCEEPVEPKFRDNVMEELRELFAEQGDVVEDSAVKRLMFFRFRHEHEAVDVIKKYNGRMLSQNRKIRVTPGNEKMPVKQAAGGAIGTHINNVHPASERREWQRGNAERPTPTPIPCFVNGNGIFDNPPINLTHMDSKRDENLVDICVFNLAKTATDDDLMQHFVVFQPLKGRVREKTTTGPFFSKKTRYGYVSFACIAAACNAQKALHGTTMNGSQIRVELAMGKGKAAHVTAELRDATNATETHNGNTRLNGNKETRRPHSRSGDESSDSISEEVISSQDVKSPPKIHSKVPRAVDDSPYAMRTHKSQANQQNSDEWSQSKPEGLPMGRGRGAWLGNVSPSFGRGLPSNSPSAPAPAPAPAPGAKKKLRPSLADLIDKIDEL